MPRFPPGSLLRQGALIIFVTFIFWSAACGPAHAASGKSWWDFLWILLLGGGGAIAVHRIATREGPGGQEGRGASWDATAAELRAQDADVSVFAPRVAPPASEILIQVFIHPPERHGDAVSAAKKIEQITDELASIPLTVQLNRRDNLKVTLDCDGAVISDSVQDAQWNGRMICLFFSMVLPTATARTILRPKLRVFVNAIPAGYVIFDIEMDPDAPDEALALSGQRGRAFKSAFLSYSSEDRVQVLKAAQLMRALNIPFFQDVLSIEPGSRWSERLLSEIEKSDLFLLFWSRHACESEWVIREAEYALQCAKSKPMEIVPILLEGPPPPPAPPSLQEIHFNDPIRYVIFAEESVSKGFFYGAQNRTARDLGGSNFRLGRMEKRLTPVGITGPLLPQEPSWQLAEDAPRRLRTNAIRQLLTIAIYVALALLIAIALHAWSGP